jgi:hypothetical protein
MVRRGWPAASSAGAETGTEADAGAAGDARKGVAG